MRRMTARLGVVGAAAFLASAVVLPLGAAAPAGAARTPSSASWQVHLNAAGANQLEDLSCPTTRECVAVGGGGDNRGVIFRTTDGGATWVQAAVPPRTPWLEFVSCPSATDCVASYWGQINGAVFLASNDGGARWRVTHRADQPQHFQIEALACVTATTCEAAGSGFFRSHNAGTNWSLTTPALARTTTGPNGLACPSTSTCFAVVDESSVDGPSGVPGTTILKTTDGGASFSVLRDGLRSPGPGLTSISCVSTTRCAVAGLGSTGRRVLWTVDGGSKWESTKVPSAPGAIQDVSCSGPGTCTLVAKASSASTTTGLVSVSTTTRGSSWSVRPLSTFVTSGPTADAQGAIACPARERCFVTGFGSPTGSIFSSATRAAPWHRAGVASGLPPLSNVSCPTSQLCVAIGDPGIVGDPGLVVRSLDGGSTWSMPATQLPSNAWLSALGCASAAYCIATGFAAGTSLPVAFVSTDGGATWVASPDPGAVPVSLSCTSSTVCVGPSVSGGLLRTVDGGKIWTSVPIPSGFSAGGFAAEVSCDAAGDCVAVASGCCVFSMDVYSSAILSSDAGATWTLLPSPPTTATEVSCTTGLTCYLLSTDIGPTWTTYSSGVFKTVDGGKDWTAVTAPSTLGPLECSVAQCVGIATTPSFDIGNAVNASVLWTGTIGTSGITWSAGTTPSTDVVLNDLAQSPSGRWVAVGGNAFNGPLVVTSP